MTSRNVLVLLLDEGHEAQLWDAVAAASDESAAVHIVAPARVSAVEWLATDEDAARTDAEVRALQAEWALQGEAQVEGEAGDADAVLAAKDALRRFPADEILLVGGASEDGGTEASIRELGLPVQRIPATAQLRERRGLREALRALARGESKATPFVLFVAVNAALLALAGVIALVVLLVLWLR